MHKDIHCNTTCITKDWKLPKCPIIEDHLNKLWGGWYCGESTIQVEKRIKNISIHCMMGSPGYNVK